jgi:hypothetical protein
MIGQACIAQSALAKAIKYINPLEEASTKMSQLINPGRDQYHQQNIDQML